MSIPPLIARLRGLVSRLAGVRSRLFQQQLHPLGVERCAIGQFADGGRSLRWTHGYAPADVLWPDLQVDIANALPWYTQQIRDRRTLVLPRALEGFPTEAAPERERIATTGLKSLLATPLEAGGELLGLISILVYSAYSDWEPSIVARLRLLAGVFANALYRRRERPTAWASSARRSRSA